MASTISAPQNLPAVKAGRILEKCLDGSLNNLTIADASLKSGLSLRDSEIGLHYLVAEYRGHLSATSKGELLFRFPTGFAKPWVKIERLEAVWLKVKNIALGLAKFVVRAWISVVMIAYVAIFAAILIGLTMANKSDERDNRGSLGGTLLFHTLFRVILDSLFWTFHPFSPFSVRRDPVYGRSYAAKKADVPFYEKVNRFFFGPTKLPADPLAVQRTILEEIRFQKGRVGLSDIMRVTGLSSEKTDSILSRLMLDYDGEVMVTSAGGIVYSFPEMRKTVDQKVTHAPPSIWSRLKKLDPFTGNSSGSNLLIAGLNGFNLVMSTVAISGGWTIAKLHWMFTAGATAERMGGMLPPMPTGSPLLLGWIPFWFSLTLFALPVMRYFRRKSEKNKIDHENGRRGLLWAVLNKLTAQGITENQLIASWQKASGVKPSEKAITREIIKLGGDMEIDNDGNTVYRFPSLEAEILGTKEERYRAGDEEKNVGEVVYSSIN